jgi:hypothetical protein
VFAVDVERVVPAWSAARARAWSKVVDVIPGGPKTYNCMARS